MATNPYLVKLPQYTEASLYEGMIIESIQWAGNDVYYLPRTLNKFDQVFGEDTLPKFSAAIPLEMYMDGQVGYTGPSEMISKFGLEIRDSATFSVSISRFREAVTPYVPTSRAPELVNRVNEGDLIYVPMTKSLFVVKFVEDNAPFWQLQKQYIWKLSCELYVLGDEIFETGIPEIDTKFNMAGDRLSYGIITQDGFNLTFEQGGDFILDEYDPSVPEAQVQAYGDESELRKEFIDILSFDETNPFGKF